MTVRSVLRAWYLVDHSSDVAGLIDDSGRPVAISLAELNAVEVTVGKFTSALKAIFDVQQKDADATRVRAEIIFRVACDEHMQPEEHADLALFHRIEAFLKWKSDPARRPAHVGARAYRAFTVAPLTQRGPDIGVDLETVSDLSSQL